MDPYDSDSSDEGSEFPLQSITPSNNLNYENYKHGQQFLIVDYTVNQRKGVEISKI
jgi:hypothetical protein